MGQAHTAIAGGVPWTRSWHERGEARSRAFWR